MRRSFLGTLAVGALLTAIATIISADDAKDEAIKKDRKLIEGTWRVVALEVDGNKATEEDARKLTVVNGSFRQPWRYSGFSGTFAGGAGALSASLMRGTTPDSGTLTVAPAVSAGRVMPDNRCCSGVRTA